MKRPKPKYDPEIEDCLATLRGDTKRNKVDEMEKSRAHEEAIIKAIREEEEIKAEIRRYLST